MTDKQLQQFKKANQLKKLQKELSSLIFVISNTAELSTKEKNSVLEPLSNLHLLIATKIHAIHKQKEFKKEILSIDDLFKLSELI